MTIRARVTSALSQIGAPVYWVKWVGDTDPPPQYMTYQTVSRPREYADNRHNARFFYIYMDLFSQTRPFELADAITEAMHQAGFAEVEQRDVSQDTLARTEINDFHISWTWVWREVA